jgi:AcrR family transcriptional regulator
MVIQDQKSQIAQSQNKRPITLLQAADREGTAAPSSMGRRQRHAVETRRRLFRCALRLFAVRGYSNVTVEDITDAADVGKGTFFNYFESKDHVLGVMAEIQLGKIGEAISDTGQGRQTIQFVLHRLMARLAEEPGRSLSLARAFISAFLANEGVRTILEHNIQAGLKMIAEVVAAGQERGEIDSRLKKELVARQLLQTCMGTILLWSLTGEPALNLRIEDSFQQFWRAIVLSGQEQKS